MPDVLVVGVGHPDRGDDAAGWLVAERLREQLVGCDEVEVVRLSADPAGLLTLRPGTRPPTSCSSTRS
jgi:Ni,Fe-hydrogenase maturation factor